jgi:O-glycosyl hydrolase
MGTAQTTNGALPHFLPFRLRTSDDTMELTSAWITSPTRNSASQQQQTSRASILPADGFSRATLPAMPVTTFHVKASLP